MTITDFVNDKQKLNALDDNEMLNLILVTLDKLQEFDQLHVGLFQEILRDEISDHRMSE